jgi:hypothetical protein
MPSQHQELSSEAISMIENNLISYGLFYSGTEPLVLVTEVTSVSACSYILVFQHLQKSS